MITVTVVCNFFEMTPESSQDRRVNLCAHADCGQPDPRGPIACGRYVRRGRPMRPAVCPCENPGAPSARSTVDVSARRQGFGGVAAAAAAAAAATASALAALSRRLCSRRCRTACLRIVARPFAVRASP